MKRPVPRGCVERLAPYVPGRPIKDVADLHDREMSEVVKLASNENPLGPSPKALAAAQAVLATVNRYPDGAGNDLREAIAARHGLEREQVVLGNGASELIDISVRAYVEPGEEVLVPEGIFRMFPVAVGRAGGSLVEIPTGPDLVPDLASLRKRISPSTKIVAIANPNNPTGAYVKRAELAELFESVPDGVLVILDEAYFEFASGVVADYPDGLEFLRKGKSLLILRTFSKIVGLAGLRIGYGFAPVEVAATLQKVREPFNTSVVAQAAALAALDDTEHMENTRALVLKERAWLVSELAARGLPPHPSVANFLLVPLPRPFAPLEGEFERRGVILRPMAGWGFPNAFRLSVGTHAENVRFLAALDEVREAGLLAEKVGAAAG